MAGATEERRLLGVGSTAMFGKVCAYRGWSLAPEQLSHHNRIWAMEAFTQLDK